MNWPGDDGRPNATPTVAEETGSLDTAGRQRASRVEYNKRAAPHLVPNDARRPQLRRAPRLSHFLHECPAHNASEYTSTPPHRRAIALPRTQHACGARRRRLPRSAARTRPPLSAALCPGAVGASRRAVPWSARCATTRHRACTARGAQQRLRWRAALAAAECSCEPAVAARRAAAHDWAASGAARRVMTNLTRA